jgi:stearoyl-CoA 9-desaturase NADPH oxidoreductase
VFFTPLLPDDYLELIDPLWSSREVRGRIESIAHETADAVTVTIRPGWVWEGHRPGQYLRVGVVVDGVHHWRAYSITSDPGRPDGLISITPKFVETGKVTPYLVRKARPGTIVRLGGVEGTFTLPDPLPRRLLFISAGSGVTPIMSMLGDLARRAALHDVVHLHSARTADAVIFRDQFDELADRHSGYRLHVQRTGEFGRLGPEDLDRLCPDWREREAFLSGSGEMLDAMHAHWKQHGDAGRLHMERFQPVIGGDGAGARAARSPSRRAARRRSRTARRRSWSPARRRASRSPSAAGWGSATPAWVACARDGYETSARGRYRARRAR